MLFYIFLFFHRNWRKYEIFSIQIAKLLSFLWDPWLRNHEDIHICLIVPTICLSFDIYIYICICIWNWDRACVDWHINRIAYSKEPYTYCTYIHDMYILILISNNSVMHNWQQADRPTDRQTDGQTDRQTNIERAKPRKHWGSITAMNIL